MEDGSVIKVFDAIGREVLKKEVEVQSTRFTLNIERLQPGIYSYKILSSENQIIDVGQFVVAR